MYSNEFTFWPPRKPKDIKIERRALIGMRVRTIIVRSSIINAPLNIVPTAPGICQADEAIVNSGARTASLPVRIDVRANIT